MISFNAGITAAHNLERGAGLGVIARSIQSLSGEVLGRTQEFAEVYGQMERLARALHSGTNRSLPQGIAGTTQLNEAVSVFVTQLQTMNQGVVQLMTTLDEEALSLAGDVVATANRITIHVEAGKIIDPLVAELDAIAASVQGAAGRADAPKIPDLLSRNYTMQSERRVHATARRSDGVDDSSSAPEHEMRDLTGLGDNVELF